MDERGSVLKGVRGKQYQDKKWGVRRNEEEGESLGRRDLHGRKGISKAGQQVRGARVKPVSKGSTIFSSPG